MKKSALLILLIFVVLCSGCNKNIGIDTQSHDISSEETSNDDLASTVQEAEEIIIFDEKYYKITEKQFEYDYQIFDETGEVVESGKYGRLPHISMADDRFVKFTLQAGTGLSTQWGYFYDVIKDVRSRVFYSIHDQHGDKVAYGTSKLVVRDIFDKTKYYKEITSFKKPFSNTVEPIVSVEFVNGGKSIAVKYLTGADYEEVTETVELG